MKFFYQVWISSSRNFDTFGPSFDTCDGLRINSKDYFTVDIVPCMYFAQVLNTSANTDKSQRTRRWVRNCIDQQSYHLYMTDGSEYTFLLLLHLIILVEGSEWVVDPERESSRVEEIQDPTISCHCLLQHVRHRGSSLLQNYCESARHYKIVLRMRWRGSCIGQYDEIWWSDFPSKIHIGGVPY